MLDTPVFREIHPVIRMLNFLHCSQEFGFLRFAQSVLVSHCLFTLVVVGLWRERAGCRHSARTCCLIAISTALDSSGTPAGLFLILLLVRLATILLWKSPFFFFFFKHKTSHLLKNLNSSPLPIKQLKLLSIAPKVVDDLTPISLSSMRSWRTVWGHWNQTASIHSLGSATLPVRWSWPSYLSHQQHKDYNSTCPPT